MKTPSGPFDWDEIRAAIGPGGIVQFQVSAHGYSKTTHRPLRQWSPRLSASVVGNCEDVDDVGSIMSAQGYPDGSYLLTARTGPGPRDWWKPDGKNTVSIDVVVGDGNPQEIDDSEEEEASEDGDELGRSLLSRIRHNHLMAQLKTSEAALDEMESRTRSRERRDAMDLFERFQDVRGDRGAGLAELLAASAPLLMPFVERMAAPRDDVHSSAAKAAIEMVTASAKAQAEISSAMMKELLETTMDNMLTIQRNQLGLDKEDDPIKALLPVAVQAALPALAAHTQGGQGGPSVPPTRTPPQSQAGAPPSAPQLPPGAFFCRHLMQLSIVRPAAGVIYDEQVRKMFGLLPEETRNRLLIPLSDEEKNPFHVFAEFAMGEEQGLAAALQEVMNDAAAVRWIQEVLSLMHDEFCSDDDERVPEDEKVGAA